MDIWHYIAFNLDVQNIFLRHIMGIWHREYFNELLTLMKIESKRNDPPTTPIYSLAEYYPNFINLETVISIAPFIT